MLDLIAGSIIRVIYCTFFTTLFMLTFNGYLYYVPSDFDSVDCVI